MRSEAGCQEAGICLCRHGRAHGLVLSCKCAYRVACLNSQWTNPCRNLRLVMWKRGGSGCLKNCQTPRQSSASRCPMLDHRRISRGWSAFVTRLRFSPCEQGLGVRCPHVKSVPELGVIAMTSISNGPTTKTFRGCLVPLFLLTVNETICKQTRGPTVANHQLLQYRHKHIHHVWNVECR